MSFSKKILCVLTASVVMAGMGVGTVSVPLSSSDNCISAYAAENYRDWRQFDSRWGSIPLGMYTMQSAGCLITAIAMLAVHSGARNADTFNPGTFANALLNEGAINQWGGISSWQSIYNIIPEINSIANPTFENDGAYTQAQKANVIKNWMSKGYYVIVNSNTHHWVLVDGVVGDKVYMIDPAKDDTEMFASYGNACEEYMIMKSKNPPREYVPPVEYQPSVKLNITQMPKTEYVLGEHIDLSGGYAQVEYVDRKKGKGSYNAECMTESPSSYIVDYTFSEYNCGSYPVTLTAYYGDLQDTVTFNVNVHMPVGEYYVTDSDGIDIWENSYDSEQYGTNENSASNSVTGKLSYGSDFVVDECKFNYGHIVSEDFDGWVNLKKGVNRITDIPEVTVGDINFDGKTDKYDLSVISEYIRIQNTYPNGISPLFSYERQAADINSDGIIDSNDITELLKRVISESN